MSEAKEQLFFDLPPADRYALSYLVRHSGIAEAVLALEGSVERLALNPSQVEMLFITGPKGSGKTHLTTAYGAMARGRALQVLVHEFLPGTVEEALIARLVDGYERLKARGGLALFTSEQGPAEMTANPHLRSRLLSCQLLRLTYPREEELQPLICSLLERHNLKLSDGSLEYLLRRLPRDPLSFDNIFGRISASSLRQARPAGQTIVREAFSKSVDRE